MEIRINYSLGLVKSDVDEVVLGRCCRVLVLHAPDLGPGSDLDPSLDLDQDPR